MNGADHDIIVIADPIGGGSSDLPPPPTLGEKRAAAEMADALAVTSITLGAAGGVLGVSGPQLWGPAVVAIVASAAAGIGAVGWNRIATDPPDPEFEQSVRVELLSLEQPTPLAAGDVDLQPMLDIFNDFIPVLDGTVTAFERAQGAEAAGDAGWSAGHATGARFLLRYNAVTLLLLTGRLRGLPAEVGATKLSKADYQAFQDEAAAHNLLPDHVESLFTEGGVDAGKLRESETLMSQVPRKMLLEGTVEDLVAELGDRLRAAIAKLALA